MKRPRWSSGMVHQPPGLDVRWNDQRSKFVLAPCYWIESEECTLPCQWHEAFPFVSHGLPSSDVRCFWARAQPMTSRTEGQPIVKGFAGPRWITGLAGDVEATASVVPDAI